MVPVTFIINGEDVVRQVDLWDVMEGHMNEAMEASGNDWDRQWELRDERGTLLDKTRTFSAYGLQPNARLFVSLAIGGGG